MQITKETRSAIESTWDSISSDAYDQCDGDNEIAMEFVLDASRLTMHGFADADKEISALCDTHGWPNVRATLSKQIQLL
jgi:hypothetical protein